MPDAKNAPVVADAFRLRAEGATIAEVRAYLGEQGIDRSYHGVESLLSSRVVLGEILFGGFVNLSAHPAIVDVDTWRRVQRAKVSRGSRAKSERLLARLGVLRCATCGSRMVVGSANRGGYCLSPRAGPMSSQRPPRLAVSRASRAAMASSSSRASRTSRNAARPSRSRRRRR
jgi:hypothetical protein